MARHLDLEEQEQIAELRHFWKTYGDWITWVLIAVLGAYAVWNGYQYWQRRQATQAAVLFDQFELAAQADDMARVEAIYNDLKQQFGSHVLTAQAGLLVAKTYYAHGKTAEAKDALRWVAGGGAEGGYAPIARLRLAALLADERAYDEALSVLQQPMPDAYTALRADRRGDVLAMQGKTDEAAREYRQALETLAPALAYRRFVDVKLAALGGENATAAPSAKSAASGRQP